MGGLVSVDRTGTQPGCQKRWHPDSLRNGLGRICSRLQPLENVSPVPLLLFIMHVHAALSVNKRCNQNDSRFVIQ